MCARVLTLNGNCIPKHDLTIATYIYIYYSLSTGKYHESVASIVTSAVGTSDNAAPDE